MELKDLTKFAPASIKTGAAVLCGIGGFNAPQAKAQGTTFYTGPVTAIAQYDSGIGPLANQNNSPTVQISNSSSYLATFNPASLAFSGFNTLSLYLYIAPSANRNFGDLSKLQLTALPIEPDYPNVTSQTLDASGAQILTGLNAQVTTYDQFYANSGSLLNGSIYPDSPEILVLSGASLANVVNQDSANGKSFTFSLSSTDPLANFVAYTQDYVPTPNITIPGGTTISLPTDPNFKVGYYNTSITTNVAAIPEPEDTAAVGFAVLALAGAGKEAIKRKGAKAVLENGKGNNGFEPAL